MAGLARRLSHFSETRQEVRDGPQTTCGWRRARDRYLLPTNRHALSNDGREYCLRCFTDAVYLAAPPLHGRRLYLPSIFGKASVTPTSPHLMSDFSLESRRHHITMSPSIDIRFSLQSCLKRRRNKKSTRKSPGPVLYTSPRTGGQISSRTLYIARQEGMEKRDLAAGTYL